MKQFKMIGLTTAAVALLIGSFAIAASDSRTKSTESKAQTRQVETTANPTGDAQAVVIKSAAQQEMEKLITEAESTPQTQTAANYEIPWSSVNGGGGPMSSASYATNSSAGQAAIGHSASTNYQIGAGYWYGTAAASGGGCACFCFGDPQCDALTNVLDVVHSVNIAFKGAPPIPDPNPACPYATTDVDCSGFTNVIDVVKFVNVAFKGQSAAAQFCSPCGP